ncbi:MAG TPA: hypothetical protein VH012_00470 [Acidimicrobiales bacterium]|nr:hypothetical protein [Acidimicrobiales bacterium]
MRSLIRIFTQQPLAAKVPEITVMFWVIKILTTAAGEAISDYLSTGNKEVGAVIEVGVFVAALIVQFSTRRYYAPAYWLLALAIAIAGTGVSDTMHLTFGIPYAGTSLFWAVALALVFYLWDRSEHTLSIHSITTSHREKFYWATIFATFALGTAVGDFTAQTLGLGYLGSAIFFCVVILIPWAGWSRFRMNEILAFWFAYVVTRPIGASFADYFSKPKELSGAGFGDLQTAAVITLLVIILVAYTTIARFDIQPPEPGSGTEVAGGT